MGNQIFTLYSVEKVDSRRAQVCISDLKNFCASFRMRHFRTNNSLIKRAPTTPKNLCSLPQEVFSKNVILYFSCEAVNWKIACT